ncbi:MAG TPA: SDR family oxidoreductase [Terriglobales bacterium]|nr:SDR family oxidoreductase [Terriglobales bacterium]
MNQKVAVVTGSSSGIGLMTAVELAKRGFRVVATMRDLARRAALAESARSAGVGEQIDVCRLDVTEFDSLPRVVSEVLRDCGRIDVLVNNAGFALAGFLEDLRLGEIRQQFETNFFGHIAMTQAVLPVMRRQRSGHIIIVSSISGLVGQPVVGAYSASKFALEGWSEALRIETRALGIRVVLIEPGAFRTGIWERNARIGEFATSPESPNHERGVRFSEAVKRVRKADPIAVARLIARIAEDPNPRLRYRIGHDAHIQKWLRALLPWRIYERLVAKAVGID